MEHPHILGPGALLVAEITSGGIGGHLLHAAASLPPWLGGGVAAFVVGVSLRVADPVLRAIGEWIAACAQAFVAWLKSLARALFGWLAAHARALLGRLRRR